MQNQAFRIIRVAKHELSVSREIKRKMIPPKGVQHMMKIRDKRLREHCFEILECVGGCRKS